MLLICLLLQRHDPPVSTQISQSRSACSPHSGMRLGHLSQRWWQGLILLPLKVCVLCRIRAWFTLLLSTSRDCGSLQEGTVLFFAALTKKMRAGVSWLFQSIFRVLWQQMQRDLRDKERMRSSCSGWYTRERKQQRSRGALPRSQCGLEACWGMAVEQSSLDHLTCLFFVFITIYVRHQHKCENSGKTNKCFLIKVNSCDFWFRYF